MKYFYVFILAVSQFCQEHSRVMRCQFFMILGLLEGKFHKLQDLEEQTEINRPSY
jgi:hypothetical protein